MSRRRKPDLAGADERRREFDEAIESARATLAAGQRKRRTRRESRDIGARPSAVSALVAEELDRRERAEAEAAERAEVERLAHPDGGGCCRCGVSHAGRKVWRPGAGDSYSVQVEPGWERDDRGWRCSSCSQDYFSMLSQTDPDRRVECVVDRVGIKVPLALELHPNRLDGTPVWFYEFPGAQPHIERWAYLDLDELRAAVDRAVNPPPPPDERERRRGARCDTCGTTMKLIEKRPASLPGGRGFEPGTVEVEQCAECLRRWWAAAGSDVEALK